MRVVIRYLPGLHQRDRTFDCDSYSESGENDVFVEFADVQGTSFDTLLVHQDQILEIEVSEE